MRIHFNMASVLYLALLVAVAIFNGQGDNSLQFTPIDPPEELQGNAQSGFSVGAQAQQELRGGAQLIEEKRNPLRPGWSTNPQGTYGRPPPRGPPKPPPKPPGW